MKLEVEQIDKLKHPEKNVRIHLEKQINELVRSLEMFGQVRPVVIDEDSVILVGNGLVKALRQMGESKVKVYRKTGLSDADKKKLMLADNKIYSLGVNNQQAIYEVLRELNLEGDFDVPGFEEEVVEFAYSDDIMGDGDSIESIEEGLEEGVESYVQGADGEEPSAGAEARQPAEVVSCPHCSELVFLEEGDR